MLPFNKPFVSGNEEQYLVTALSSGHLSGDGYFSRKSSHWLEENLGTSKALLTHSCTASLEMASILADVQPGDEIILPSYTFVSTANAFVLRGATPVFVDVRKDNFNIDESRIEAAITSKTKAIVPVHYAGKACEMDTIMDIAQRHNLIVIEDAAQAITSKYKGKSLGSIGHFGCISFHETKNIQCGEGGALLVNDPKFIERAEIVREKGTNRSKFIRGQVDKYTWQDLGSSYLPSELNAAFLYGQLENIHVIQKARQSVWHNYKVLFESCTEIINSKIEIMQDHQPHNSHMFYLRAKNLAEREALRLGLAKAGVMAVSHYVPLHSSPAGRRFGRTSGSMEVSEIASESILRLPLYPEFEGNEERALDAIVAFLRRSND